MERQHNMSVRATEVGLLARAALRSTRRGRIVAVFERSLYTVFHDDWVCIGSKSIGSGPLHVLCEDFAPIECSVGQDVAVSDTELWIGGALRLTGLGQASTWSPPPRSAWTSATLQVGLLEVDGAWRVAPTDEGLAASGWMQLPLPSTPTLAAALPGIAALRRSIAAGLRGEESASGDERAISELIGLGPGLTPSGDDLLGGALVALACLGFVETRDGLWDALRGHLDRTNDISAVHLRSAASGYAASALHEAVDATMSGSVDRIAPALAAVSAIGHSSGRDAFAGALIALRAAGAQAFCGDDVDRHPVTAAQAA